MGSEALRRRDPPPSLPRADAANASIGPAGCFWNIVRFNFQLGSLHWVTFPCSVYDVLYERGAPLYVGAGDGLSGRL